MKLNRTLALALLPLLAACSMTPRPPLAETDKMFVMESAQSSNAEIELSEIALEKSSSAQVREFARRMKADHALANEQLARIASDQDLALPTEPDPTQVEKSERLADLKGTDFDREYMNHMVAGHAKLLEMFKVRSQTAQNPTVRTFATSQVPVVAHHLDMARVVANELNNSF